MYDLFKLKSPIGRSYNTDPEDVRKTKKALSDLGYYEEPDFGITPYPNTSMMNGLENFQRDFGLRLDGVMKPGGETAQMLGSANHINAQNLQSLGRNGDSILAHITPGEARLLKRKCRAGTINPKTGLLEFSKESNKEGEYIWRTEGDSKVRSSHAERNGKTFSWDNPPEGGHPGEAENCRCTAEAVKKPTCLIEKLEFEKIAQKLTPKEAELGEVERRINNINLKIEDNYDDIALLEEAEYWLTIGSSLTKAKNRYAKVAGYVSELTLGMIKAKIYEIEAELKTNIAKLENLAKERSKLEKEVQSLKNREQIAQQAYNKCLGK
ncbi:MAG: hypothetical protein COB59_04605 [Rhodospirillaceae bacterium]|nr:MAG: hypothetical protein COB59_04605 [Rhodospirillaceae bacterium]